MTIILLIYLVFLIIAPQLWIGPIEGLRTDVVLYPIWFAALIVSGRLKDFMRFTTQDKYLALFIIWVVVSIVVNGFQEISKDIIFDYVKWFVLYKLVVASVKDFEELKKVILMIIFFGLLMTIEGIQHKLSPDGLGWAGQKLGWVDPRVLAAGGIGRTRWINIFDGPGVFCVIYTLAFPFLLQYLGKPFNKKTSLVAAALIAPLLLAIYYTGSRGGLLATAALFGLYFLIRFQVSFSKILLIVGAAFVVLTLAPEHITSIRDPMGSAQHRVDMWAEGIEMVQQNPVFGIGRGNFLNYTSMLIAHNSAVEIMGEMGVIGLFFWSTVIYLALKSIYENRKINEDPVQQAYLAGLGLSLIGYLISAMFVTLEYETFYFMLALCAASGRMVEGEITLSRKEFKRTWGIMLIFFVLLKGFVMLYY